MTRKKSKLLVIDASVARASGDSKAQHPLAKCNRDFLIAVLEVCHQCVFTQPILSEWKKHESAFARSWRVSMVARRKVRIIKENVTDATLRQTIAALDTTQAKRNAMLKDCHLIEAAQLCHRIIVALDDNARLYFASASTTIPSLRSIAWANPTAQPCEQIHLWLKSGASPADYLLNA